MKARRTALIAVFALVATVAAGLGWAQMGDAQTLVIPLAENEIIASTVRTGDGTFLVGRRSQQRVRIAIVSTDLKIEEGAVLEADGPIVDFELASSPSDEAGTEGAAIAVLASCPDGFGEQLPTDDFKNCVGPLKAVSIELDTSDGQAVGPQKPLPAGTGSGSLFASSEAYVWDSWDANPAIYSQGEWQNPTSKLSTSTRIDDRCASKDAFWVMTGNDGPRSVTGQDNAQPISEPGYELFRYELDASLGSEWQAVAIGDLEKAGSADLACGDQEAFLRVDHSLISTNRPDKPIAEAEGIVKLRSNPALRPIAILEHYDACAVVLPGGILKPGDEEAGTIRKAHSICDAVPWPTEDGLLAVEVDSSGKMELKPW